MQTTNDAITIAGRAFDAHVNFCGVCRDILTLCPEGLRLHEEHHRRWQAEHSAAMRKRRLALVVEPLGALCEVVR